MNRITCLALALLGLAGVAQAEKVNVVQITDMRGQIGFEVMNREEFNALAQAIKEETAVFAASVAECKKEWESNKENKLPFQGGRIKPRSAKKSPMEFADREKADKKKAQLEERMNDKLVEEMDKESKKQKTMKDEDVQKADLKTQAFEDAYTMISKKMAEKLKRDVPAIGFVAAEPSKEEPKKDEKKAEAKKEEKKDEAKKDEKKADEKKDEKKAAH